MLRRDELRGRFVVGDRGRLELRLPALGGTRPDLARRLAGLGDEQGRAERGRDDE